MKGKTLFLLAAVVAAVSQAAVWQATFAGDLKPCACNPSDAAMSSMTNVVACGEQFTTPRPMAPPR